MNVAQFWRAAHRVEQIGEHPRIALNQARRIGVVGVGAIKNVTQIAVRRESFATGGGIEQIHGEMAITAGAARWSAGHGQHVTLRLAREVAQ
jgi:hypothetical protein